MLDVRKYKWIALLVVIVGIVAVLIYIDRWWYSRTVNRRRNVPVEQRMNIMKTLLEIIYKAAEQSNTSPFLLYGTLLGYVRDKDFICYDFDVDVGIETEEYNNLKQAIKEVLLNYPDFEFKDKSFLGYNTYCIIHKNTLINGDIFEFIKKRDTYQRNVPYLYSKYILKERVIYIPRNWIYPLQEVEFKGFRTYIPLESRELLKSWYGNDYVVSDHVCNLDCSVCERRK